MVTENPLIEIKKSVSFIFIKNKEQELIANGTGFFVGVLKENDHSLYSVYFVTAKHVLTNKKGDYYDSIFLRLNLKEGDSEYIEIKLKQVELFTHEDENVDLVLFNCLPNQEKFDFKFIPDQLFTNSEIVATNGISEGDDMFFSGLFTSHIGQKRNQPIVRFGKVALMPEEKIEWNDPPKLMDLYLMECQSFGGNSGSPVFFHLSPFRRPGIIAGTKILLAGVMTGCYLDYGRIQFLEAITLPHSAQNVGIAAVTPSDKLYDILYSEKLIEKRKE